MYNLLYANYLSRFEKTFPVRFSIMQEQRLLCKVKEDKSIWNRWYELTFPQNVNSFSKIASQNRQQSDRKITVRTRHCFCSILALAGEEKSLAAGIEKRERRTEKKYFPFGKRTKVAYSNDDQKTQLSTYLEPFVTNSFYNVFSYFHIHNA